MEIFSIKSLRSHFCSCNTASHQHSATGAKPNGSAVVKTKLINLITAGGRVASPIAVAAGAARVGAIADTGPARLRSVLLRFVPASLAAAKPVAGNTGKTPALASLSRNASLSRGEDQRERLKEKLHPGGTPQVVGRYL